MHASERHKIKASADVLYAIRNELEALVPTLETSQGCSLFWQKVENSRRSLEHVLAERCGVRMGSIDRDLERLQPREFTFVMGLLPAILVLQSIERLRDRVKVELEDLGAEADDLAAVAGLTVLSGPWLETWWANNLSSPSESVREAAAFETAGAVCTKTALHRDRDLCNALGGTGISDDEAFLERILGAVIVAWSGMNPGDPLFSGADSLFRKTLNVLEGEGIPREECLAGDIFAEGYEGRLAEFPANPAEELEMRELAEALPALLEKGSLTPREREVLDLIFVEGRGRADICKLLGIAEGTFDVLRARAITKLRRAAGLS